MIIEKTSIPDVLLITNKRFGDDRGWFAEVLRSNELNEATGKTINFVQINESVSGANILRGIHLQNPQPQGKLVRVVEGEVFDVAVDIRKNSKTFGKWTGAILSEENKNMLYIPEGFAHGFLTLSDTAELLYKASGEYSPQNDKGLLWCDTDINIDWKKYGLDFEPILSDKDKIQPRLKDIKEEDLL